MKTIYKWTLALKDVQVVTAPRDTEFLTVQVQHREPQVWGVCDPTQPPEETVFHMRGTGHPMPEKDNLLYMGSFQLDNGLLVFHVFREIYNS